MLGVMLMRKSIGLVSLIILALASVFPVSALLVFSDDFERQEVGPDWTVVKEALTIENGELNAEGIGALLSSGDYYTDFSVEVKAKIIDYGPSAEYWVGLIARATNPIDDCWASGYLVYLRYDGRIELFTYEDAVIAWAQTDITPDNFVTIVASFNGTNIRVYVNGELYINVNHSRYSAGYFSLKNYVAHAHFDDVLVENPPEIPNFNVVPEPASIIISLLLIGAFATYGLIRYKKPSIRSPTA